MFGRKTTHPETSVRAKAPRPDARSGKTPGSTVPPAASQAPVVGKGEGKGEAKRAYEARRAEKAGMGLEKWMAEKERRSHAERDAIAQARRKSNTDRQNQAAKPGLLRRLLDRAHRPL